MSKYDEPLVEPGNPDNSHSVALELVGPDRRVLDVGCATGYLARALVGQGCTVTGVDNDAEAAEKARESLERLVIADLDTVDLTAELAGERYEAIVFGDVLEHLRDPAGLLRQARRLLVPGGHIVISIPNIAHGDVAMSLLRGEFAYRPLGLLDETHIRFYTYASLRSLLAVSGFVLLETRRVGKPLFATEMGIPPESVAPEVVAALRQSAESETYQFVVRAVPDDLDGQLSRLAARDVELSTQATTLQRSLDVSQRQLAEATDALALAEAERDLRAVEAERSREELQRLLGSRTLRWSRSARAVYGTLRALQ